MTGTHGRGRRAAAVLAAAVALAGCGSAAAAGAGKAFDGVVQHPGLAKPDLTLTDTSGRPYDLRARTEGHLTLLYFGYTHCPDVCPTQMADIAVALQRVPAAVARNVVTVFVTTDPARDTGPVLRSWLDNFSTSFVGLTGTDAQIAAAETAVGLPPSSTQTVGGGDYTVSHSAEVLAFTGDNVSHVVFPAGVGVAAYAHDLPKLANGWSST